MCPPWGMGSKVTEGKIQSKKCQGWRGHARALQHNGKGVVVVWPANQLMELSSSADVNPDWVDIEVLLRFITQLNVNIRRGISVFKLICDWLFRGHNHQCLQINIQTEWSSDLHYIPNTAQTVLLIYNLVYFQGCWLTMLTNTSLKTFSNLRESTICEKNDDLICFVF